MSKTKVVPINPGPEAVEEVVQEATGRVIETEEIPDGSTVSPEIIPQLAIMRQVSYGVCPLRQLPVPALWFRTYISEEVFAWQILIGRDVDNVIMSSGVKDVSELEGRACWVSVNHENQQISFVSVSGI